MRMTAAIRLGPLELDPVEIGSQGNAVLGIRDSGKSYTATYLAERLFEAGIPFVAFDPIGVWRFLRVPGGPKGKGYPIVVAGGEEGDLPLSTASAPMIVEAAMQNGVSLVIDLFDMNISKADWRRIVKDCVRLLLHRNKQYGLRHIFLEEAAEFAPQKVLDGDVYAEIEKLARMGGNSRLGYTLINQRSQEVNKAVLELCDNLFLHRQKGKNALENLKKWMEVAGAAGAEVMRTIPNLPQGECWAWLSGSDTPVHLKVPAKRSLHPDRRVVHNEIAAEVVKKAAVNVDSFVSALKETLPKLAEEAKANDPAKLKAEVARLTRELARAQQGNAPAWHDQRETVAKLTDELAATSDALVRLTASAKELEKRQKKALAALTGEQIEIPEAPPRIAAPRPAAPPIQRPAPAPREPIARKSTGLRQSHQKVLDSLAWWKAAGFPTVERRRACIMAGYSPKASTFGVYISELTRDGLVEVPEPGRLALTESGEQLSHAPDMTSSGAILDAAREQLSQAEIRLFNEIVADYPEWVTRHDLADRVGLSRTASTLGVYLSKIGSFDFIETARGQVRAEDWLFV